MCTPKVCFSSLRYVFAKHEDKVPDVSSSDQNIQTSCKSKLKLIKLKDLVFKNTEKIVKDECL